MTLFEMFNEQLLSHASDEVKQFIGSIYAGRIGKILTSCKVPMYLRDVIERGWKEEPEERPTLSEYRSILSGTNYLAQIYICRLKDNRLQRLFYFRNLPLTSFANSVPDMTYNVFGGTLSLTQSISPLRIWPASKE